MKKIDRRGFLDAGIKGAAGLAMVPTILQAGSSKNYTQDDYKVQQNNNVGNSEADWRENYAYTLGVQAYIFSYPWVFLSQIQYQWVAVKPKNPELMPNMPINQWWHARNIITDAYRDGGAPNNDTLYSASWLDVGKEPIILSHGDMDDRYFTFEIASFNSDNFAYVGTRTTGAKAGHFAITGPGWEGELPNGVAKLPASPTESVLIFGRTAVKGAKDVSDANKAQDSYKLTPLSLWGKVSQSMPENRNVSAPFNLQTDPLADWKTINKAMVKNPPLKQHAVLLDMFKKIGVGPGLDVDSVDEATRRGLVRASADGGLLLKTMLITGLGLPKINGWSVPPRTMGRAMINNDFNIVALQCMGGIISNDPEEAIYMNTHTSADGQTLNGKYKYAIRFEPDQLPDVKYFWSLTMYDLTNNLVTNSINRWAISSLSGGYKLASDGSLTLFIQKDSPGKAKEANWLPAPDGDFWVVFRIYGPTQKIIDSTWKMPPLAIAK